MVSFPEIDDKHSGIGTLAVDRLLFEDHKGQPTLSPVVGDLDGEIVEASGAGGGTMWIRRGDAKGGTVTWASSPAPVSGTPLFVLRKTTK